VTVSLIQRASIELRGFDKPQAKAIEKLLGQMFPVEVVETRTAKGNLSTKQITEGLLLRLGSLGFEKPGSVAIAGTRFGLEPDFFRRGAGDLGGISGELQLALRECVPYDFLKHAMLQRMGYCHTSIEIVPTGGLAGELRNACATFDWAKTVLDNLVLPVRDLRIALVGIELCAVRGQPVGVADQAEKTKLSKDGD
jgi:hypothetical protein